MKTFKQDFFLSYSFLNSFYYLPYSDKKFQLENSRTRVVMKKIKVKGVPNLFPAPHKVNNEMNGKSLS